MRRVRLVHAVVVLLAGSAGALALLDFLRTALIALAIATILHAWSLEMLRSVTIHRETI